MGNQAATAPFRRADVGETSPAVPFNRRWYGKVFLLLLAVGLLSLSFAPIQQFFLAWIGLVPWLIVLKNCRSVGRAFLWSWLAGTLFFTANMWWLAHVTGPGVVALMPVLGLYWAFAGTLVRGLGLVRTADWAQTEANPSAGRHPYDPRRAVVGPPYLMISPALRVLGIATVWCALEWLRGTWPFQGLPWLYLGMTQSTAPPLIQIADAAGVAGVSFWIAMVNAWVALLCLNRFGLRRLLPALSLVLAVSGGVVGYGYWRLDQTAKVVVPGPTILVVQPNYPQSNTGEKGAHPVDIVNFHAQATTAVLDRRRDVDLVVWSETMLPPINREARSALRGVEFPDFAYGDFLQRSHELLMDLGRKYRAAFVVGGQYAANFAQQQQQERTLPRDARNTAYFYDRSGTPSDRRYDKIHLVPFGEFIPFKESIPWLYRLLIALGPTDMEAYQLTRGGEDELTVFPLSPAPPSDYAAANANGVARPGWRFVTPICFEDIDPRLVARMFRGTDADGQTTKRADLIVNLTNDGWFKANENAQHLEAAIFRSIENRAPTARSVNTGISGFIDSAGRAHDLIPVRTEGTAVARVGIDPRLTLFTRWGDWFSHATAAATALMAGGGIVRWWIRRRGTTTAATP